MRIIVQASSSYDIFIEQHFKSILPLLSISSSIVLVCDEHVASVYQKKFGEFFGAVYPLLIVPSGEQYKTRKTKAQLEDQLFDLGCGRDTLLIAIGGGVVLDLVGFLAANFCRGIPVIYVPTSLLAMVDASIGGKTAVNTPYGKNLIGSFSNPKAVLIYTQFLKTLPKKEFTNGMAEVLKHGLIRDLSFLKWLMTHRESIQNQEYQILESMILQSTTIKQAIVEADEFEKTSRQILNFGHTIGHALERLSNYELPHGEAVAIGMVFEAYISFLKGLIPLNSVTFIQELLTSFGLPIQTSLIKDFEEFLQYLYFDKKNKHDEIYIVLLNQLGGVYSQDEQYSFPVSMAEIKQTQQWMLQIC